MLLLQYKLNLRRHKGFCDGGSMTAKQLLSLEKEKQWVQQFFRRQRATWRPVCRGYGGCYRAKTGQKTMNADRSNPGYEAGWYTHLRKITFCGAVYEKKQDW